MWGDMTLDQQWYINENRQIEAELSIATTAVKMTNLQYVFFIATLDKCVRISPET